MKKSKIVTIGLVAISINLGYGNNKNIGENIFIANENTDFLAQKNPPQNLKNTADTTGKSSVNHSNHKTRGIIVGFFRRGSAKSITRGGFGKATTTGDS